ncbi:MAG: thiamine diphosphokinase [Anaerolineae bacterium]
MNTLIIANGPAPSLDQLRYEAETADLVIAADGGAVHILAAKLFPDLVIGDLDSVPQQALDALREAEVELLKYPTHKNETDLELAVAEAIKRRATSITIMAAVGGRLDQTLANVFLLAEPQFSGIPIRICTEREEVFLVRNQALIHGAIGDTVSLIPLTPQVRGVTTRGLEYPLEDAVLRFGPTLGISNSLYSEEGMVALREGLLLVVHQTTPSAAPVAPRGESEAVSNTNADGVEPGGSSE